MSLWEMETVTYPKARKEYVCEASWHINQTGYGERDYDPEDWAAIQKAMEENFKILKGTQYINIKGKFDGDFTTFRARIDMDKICHKYEFYSE